MKRKKILVVDNEPEAVKGFEVRLKHWGYDVVTAYSAEECFETAEKEKPDLVLLDILMPGINGISACSKLRRNHNVPVIMVTALNDSATMHDADLFGAYEFITKPVDDEELKQKIRETLNFHKKNDQKDNKK